MICSIENASLKIEIKQLGGEMVSLFNKTSNTEMLWEGNPEYWNGQAPILFPIIGNLKENTYYYNDKPYHLNRHGFARKSDEWNIEKVDNLTIKATLQYSEASLQVYPFEFKLVVTYALKENILDITHEIINLDTVNLPFSIGGHTAYNILSEGSTHEDYFITFENKETEKRYFLNDNGLITGETEVVLEKSDQLQITKNLFDDDALVFKHLNSNTATLNGPTGKMIEVSFKDFPFLGIWAAPKAPFVCIEPWIGHADTIESKQDLFDKEGSISLAPSQSFKASYQIKVF